MPVLDREAAQPKPRAAGGGQRVPIRVPETRPAPLQDQYIYLSAFAAVCGAIAISSLELGASLGSPIVKLCVLLGAPPLAVAMAVDALRIWRSAWAWLPVNRGRAWFRFSWVAAILVLYAALCAAAWLVFTA
jgi:hypothetical protein